MKLFFAALSLACNIVLATVWFAHRQAHPIATPAAIEAPAYTRTKASFDTADNHGLVAQLRAEGFPPDIIRSIILILFW